MNRILGHSCVESLPGVMRTHRIDSIPQNLESMKVRDFDRVDQSIIGGREANVVGFNRLLNNPNDLGFQLTNT